MINSFKNPAIMRILRTTERHGAGWREQNFIPDNEAAVLPAELLLQPDFPVLRTPPVKQQPVRSMPQAPSGAVNRTTRINPATSILGLYWSDKVALRLIKEQPIHRTFQLLCQPEGQGQRGVVLVVFNGVDGLAGDPAPPGQLFLRDAPLFAQLPDPILHRQSPNLFL